MVSRVVTDATKKGKSESQPNNGDPKERERMDEQVTVAFQNRLNASQEKEGGGGDG